MRRPCADRARAARRPGSGSGGGRTGVRTIRPPAGRGGRRRGRGSAAVRPPGWRARRCARVGRAGPRTRDAARCRRACAAAPRARRPGRDGGDPTVRQMSLIAGEFLRVQWWDPDTVQEFTADSSGAEVDQGGRADVEGEAALAVVARAAARVAVRLQHGRGQTRRLQAQRRRHPGHSAADHRHIGARVDTTVGTPVTTTSLVPGRVLNVCSEHAFRVRSSSSASMVRACAKRLSGTAPAGIAYLCTITGHARGTAVEGAAMDDKTAGRRGGWRLRAAASGAAAAVLLGGCSAGASERAAEPGTKASDSRRLPLPPPGRWRRRARSRRRHRPRRHSRRTRTAYRVRGGRAPRWRRRS